MIVPYQNLKLIHKPLMKEFKKSFSKNLKMSNFILGKNIYEFEKKFSKYSGTKYSVGVSNGTDAIFLSIRALDLPVGSEIILSSMTYISAAYSVLLNSYKLVLCDIDYETGLMNLDLLKKKINNKTKCIISTDLNGNVINQNELRRIIGKKKIYIINDSSHAHGSFDCFSCENNKSLKCCRKGNKAGSNSDISCFSLYPGKNLGALGDAGIITTNIKSIYLKLLKLRNFGSKKKYFHDQIGFNFKMDSIQASFLNIKLNQLDKWNKSKSIIAETYNKKINNKNIKFLKNTKGSSYYGFILLTKYRNKLRKFLEKKNIQTNIYYPFAINKHNALKKIFKKKKFIQAETYSKNSIAIPICSSLTKKQINYVIKIINSFKN